MRHRRLDRCRRRAGADHRSGQPPPVQRAALPARHRRDGTALRPGSAQAAHAARWRHLARGGLGRGAGLHRRAHGGDQGQVGLGSPGADQPRARRELLQAHDEGLWRSGGLRTELCPVPRRAGHRLHADLRAGSRLAGKDGHGARHLHGAHRLAPGREHAQHPGAGVRPIHRAWRRAGGGGPPLFHRGGQGQVVAAHQAGHGPGAAAGVDSPADPRGRLQPRLRGAPLQRL